MPLPTGLRRPLVAVALAATLATLGAGCGSEPASVSLAAPELPLPTVPAEVAFADDDLPLADIVEPDVDAAPSERPSVGLEFPAEALAPTTEPTADAGEIADAAAELAGAGEDDWRVLAGFTGRRWSQEATGRVRVLEDTVVVADGIVTGLVRNERAVPVEDVEVSAGGVSTTVAVPVLRPGEPGPFRLELSSDVASPRLQVTAADTARAPVRDMAFVTWWQHGVADEGTADTYLWTEPDDAPPARMTFGSVEAWAAVEDLVVVGAHVDADGRVLGVGEAIVADRDVDADGATDWLLVVPGPAALDQTDLMIWGAGS